MAALMGFVTAISLMAMGWSSADTDGLRCWARVMRVAKLVAASEYDGHCSEGHHFFDVEAINHFCGKSGTLDGCYNSTPLSIHEPGCQAFMRMAREFPQ